MKNQIKSVDELKSGASKISGTLGSKDVFTALVIILVGFAGFGLGKLSTLDSEKPPVTIEDTFSELRGASSLNPIPELSERQPGGEVLPATVEGGLFVASKKGTKYHFPWCPGAQQMSEENKIWFESKEEAELAGYTAASNCKGL